MREIKVAHITTIDLSLRYLLLNQMQSIQEAGYQVTGISSTGPDVSAIEAAGIRHIAVPMTRNPFTPLQDLQSLWRLYRIIRRERFTIVHTHTPKPGLLGQLAAQLAGVPIIVNTLHGFYFHDRMRPQLRFFYILLEKIAARCSSVILSQNGEDVGTAVRERICPPEKIKHLGNGINLRRFDPDRISQAEIAAKRAEVGLPKAPIVGFVGRLVAEKGLLELFAAAQQVRAQIPSVHFVFVGPVDTKPDALTPDTAREYGIADVSHFLGMRRDMPELYSLMDVFVLPSHREGFPRAPMEAAAMRVPCVVTDIRGCRETVEHGRNGLLVPLGNTGALADAIVQLLTDREGARRMGEEGRRMAAERFDERAVFEKVKSEYARLLTAKDISTPTPRISGSEMALPV